jgi:AAA domain
MPDDALARLDRLNEARRSPDGGAVPGLRTLLSIEAWADRRIPPPDRLLGDLVTTTTRMFLVGRTGLGKTMFGFAMACGMANGEGFSTGGRSDLHASCIWTAKWRES